jgi:gamma-glutamylcyclotransferase (GGCT)/AIG2-like uncharacterized protein YtfP
MPDQGVYHLFVYGSLRSGFPSPAYEYISRYFTLVGNAKVQGSLVDLGPYPAGIPSSDGNAIVGELYIIKNENEFSWAIAQLDDYEGVVTEVGEEQLFRRELTEVHINEQTIPAWVYWYNGDVTGKPVVASGDILQYLEQKK